MQIKRSGWGAGALALALLAGATGCVTLAEHEKLRKRVIDLERGGLAKDGSRERVAELGAQLTRLEQQDAELQGRIEVLEHKLEEALGEARAARAETAKLAARIDAGSGSAAAAAAATPEVPAGEEGVGPAELQAYREAYAAWRTDDPGTCIDRFRSFLQTYPSSPYADDAAYWMADCYFKQGDFKTAVLRFDDVVNRYPSGNKAPDALYRQGEALMRMGPGYGSAAGKAFERVLKEYPDSERAKEAKRQLQLLGSG
jgi:tol-pal system protein YbgF